MIGEVVGGETSSWEINLGKLVKEKLRKWEITQHQNKAEQGLAE